MTTTTLTLTDFLLARIAEDRIRVIDGINHRAGGADWRDVRLMEFLQAATTTVRAHPLDTPPAGSIQEAVDPNVYCRTCEGGGVCDTLHALALPYADHPDCREEWRP